MFRVKSIAVIASLLAAASMSGVTVRAADSAEASSEIVEYRLENWKTTHGSGQPQTDKLVATLEKLRCEVKLGAHGGHTDIHYRCPKWQKLALKDHASAHQWELWLKKYGFQTKHVH